MVLQKTFHSRPEGDHHDDRLVGTKARQRYAHVAPLEMLSWLTKNLLIGNVLAPRLGAGRYLVCRYEDLMSDPGPVLERICVFAGPDATDLVKSATTGVGVARHHLY